MQVNILIYPIVCALGDIQACKELHCWSYFNDVLFKYPNARQLLLPHCSRWRSCTAAWINASELVVHQWCHFPVNLPKAPTKVPLMSHSQLILSAWCEGQACFANRDFLCSGSHALQIFMLKSESVPQTISI